MPPILQTHENHSGTEEVIENRKKDKVRRTTTPGNQSGKTLPPPNPDPQKL
jgi:hypothetical protein